MRYKFPLEVNRALVVEALRVAADRFGTVADHLELGDDDGAERAAEYARYRKKSQECDRIAGEIERDTLFRPHSRSRLAHGAHPHQVGEED